MKIERIVITLFLTALFAVACSVYYASVNFNLSEYFTYTARHANRVIEAAYRIQFQAVDVENASDKYLLYRKPYYAKLASRNEAALANSVQQLLDSVKENALQVRNVTDLKVLTDDIKKLPGISSSDSAFSDSALLAFRNGEPQADVDKIIDKTHEIITEEFSLLYQRRATAYESQKNTINAIYFTAALALLFILFILFRLNRGIRQNRFAEAKIRENEERLRILFDEVGDVIYSADFNGNFTFINPRLESLTGYTTPELLGKPFSFLVHPDWLEKVKDFYFNQFKKRIIETRFEFPIVTKQGLTKWVEQNVVLVSKGNLVDSFKCVVRDITQRKNAEEEIRRTNKFLDSVLENIPNMIFIKDAANLRFLRVNKAGEQLLGYKQEQLLGKNDYDFFPKQQADFFTSKDSLVLKSSSGVDIPEEPIQTLNGQRWLHTKKIPVADSQGKPLYLLGISEDITERKKNEDTIIELNKNLARYIAELEESQRFYKTIARNFPDGTISVIDQNLNYIFVDGGELALEGLTTADLLGTPYLNRFPDELRDNIKNNLLQIFQGKNASFEVSLQQNYYIIHGAPLSNNRENIREILLVKQNITKLKQAEENIIAALEKEKLINELKSRFVALASHEFRTPLSTILSSTELIGEYIEHDGKNPAIIKEKNTKHLNRIKSSVQNMVNILNNFLSLDQLEQGKTLTNPTTFDINTLSAEIIEELTTKLKPGQKITYTQQSKHLSQIFTDRLILKNILLNLLSNAVKYSPEKSIISLYANVTNRGLKFSVEDHGIGIPQSEQENLFERFFRAKNTLNIEGSGLGLSIVKKYIDLINGHISFSSRENVGTTFTVFIANAPAPQTEIHSPTLTTNAH